MMWSNLKSMENERKVEYNGVTYFVNCCKHCPFCQGNDIYSKCIKFDYNRIDDINQIADYCELEKRYA